MMESATVSMTTMAVAADSPPTKASSVSQARPARRRQREHEAVAVGARTEGQQPRHGDGHHEEIDRDEVEREQPGGAFQVADAGVLHHRHVELARQQHDGAHGEQRHGHPAPALQPAAENLRDLRRGRHAAEQRADAAHEPEGGEDADGQEGDELDRRLHRDGEDEPALVLGGVRMAGAEQGGEHGHGDGDDEDEVAARFVPVGRQQIGERERHRPQLQRDIGDDPDHRDDGDQAPEQLVLAVARRDEVGDGRDVLALGNVDDGPHHGPADGQHQDRPDIDRQEVVARGRGDADAAEIGPGRAIDRQRQGIDQRPRAAAAPPGRRSWRWRTARPRRRAPPGSRSRASTSRFPSCRPGE
jgi:hypothetical protein